MNEIIEHCRRYYESPPVPDELSRYNRLFKDRRYHLHYKDVFPCFFTGDIEKKDQLLAISLNPRLDKTTWNEQGNCFQDWMCLCNSRFTKYESDEEIPPVFKNILKVFFDPKEIKRHGKKALLQDNIVNIDWCFYYSSRFRSLGKSFYEKHNIIGLYELFNNNIKFFVDQIKPRCIFVHGISEDIVTETMRKKGRKRITLWHGNRRYRVEFGRYGETKIPLIYQRWFINRGNKEENLTEIRNCIKEMDSHR